MNEGQWSTPRLRAWRAAEEVADSSLQLRKRLLKRIIERWGGESTEPRLEAIDNVLADLALASLADYLEQYSDWPLTDRKRMIIFLEMYQIVADHFLAWLTGRGPTR